MYAIYDLLSVAATKMVDGLKPHCTKSCNIKPHVMQVKRLTSVLIST